MYLDRDAWPPPRPWQPPPRKPRLTKRDEKVLTWLIGLALIAWLCAPLAGATLFDALIAMLRG